MHPDGGSVQGETKLPDRNNNNSTTMTRITRNTCLFLLIAFSLLLAGVARLHLPHARSDASEFVTLSIGVASVDVPGHSSTPAALIALADQNLYQAKAHGRAQVYCATPVEDAALQSSAS